MKTRVRGTRLLKLLVSAFVFAFCCRQLVFNRGHNEQKNEEGENCLSAGIFFLDAFSDSFEASRERENFKIKEYLIYLKKFWNKLLLYNSLLTISSYFFFDELGVVIVYSISLMLPLPIFIYQSNKNFKK